MAIIKEKKPVPAPVKTFDIKLAVMEHFRFKKQWICVDECLHADVIADSGKRIVEVEVKVTREDLIRGEAKKAHKHQNYDLQFYKSFIPNLYYFCVPYELKDVAVEYAAKLNPKYGVMYYSPATGNVITVKRARALHKEYSEKHRHQIAKRCSCKLITLMQKENEK